MVALKVLQPIQIASPCDASWEDMHGDDKRRFCGQCDKFVYNLPDLDPEEFVDLVERTEGKFCGRIYRRQDNTVLTNDCPVGVRRLARITRMKVAGALAVSLSLVATGISYLFNTTGRCTLDGPKPTVVQIIEEKVETIRTEFIEPEEFLMGEMVEAPPVVKDPPPIEVPPIVKEPVKPPPPPLMGKIIMPQEIEEFEMGDIDVEYELEQRLNAK